MFVIVEAWKNLSMDQQKLPIPEKIAMSLKHAGVSITVTSVTDIVAFGIGASTVSVSHKTLSCHVTLLSHMTLFNI